MTLGPFTSQRPRQCFNISIINDVILEQTEDFATRLTLIPISVTTINADRIIVDPAEAAVWITDNDLSKYNSISTYWLVWHIQPNQRVQCCHAYNPPVHSGMCNKLLTI